ncbi:MAG TPA: 2-amino-4-hydroxy-6-hydroxymethyldihydropteridine diphosphokinase [Kofleriaceae bacterium]|nr:2-amino-4-hydroxy-6-hydroxymethyldihydropteridine diphosphokinase [Kofleriaceae bacterium]
MKTLPEDALVIGLGGNVGGDAAIMERFCRARSALAQLGDVRSAPLYRTAPIGPDQPEFLNTAVRVRLADAIPDEVIATVLEIEHLLGRNRATEEHWGPRKIDLDVLVWGTRAIRTPELEIPHPRWNERLFVVRPLIDLFGEETVIAGEQLGTLAERLASQPVELVSDSW